VDLVVPGVLEEFDLPEVAAALGSRPVWLVAPEMPSGSLAQLETAQKEYQAAKNVRVLERPEGWSFAAVYGDWLKP
jgi:hypothetical protein